MRHRTCFAIIAMAVLGAAAPTAFARTFADFSARPPIHMLAGASDKPHGLTPKDVRTAYGLPASGGSGTIALIEAYDSPNIAADLAAFSTAFNLPSCTIKNKCLTIHRMSAVSKQDQGWQEETALDVEWAHAIAPLAKILIVEATSDSGSKLLAAVDYARKRSDVVAISMSWGGDEFSGEVKLDSHFTANHPVTFTASSGDNGSGASWPAASSKVIAVGGTSLVMNSSGGITSEKAWNGSGGGVSAFESEPSYQSQYSIPRANGKRAIPDVSFAADPAHGFSVYHDGSWSIVGGTSAGAPQWAAMSTLGQPFAPLNLYAAKASVAYGSFFRDITGGSNGDCTYYCAARKHYDYITGLGSPLTYRF